MVEILAKHPFSGGQVVEIAQGDITLEDVDAIVNAANEFLAHGGGVAGAISRRGGPRIQEESNAWVRQHGTVTNAQPAVTSGGQLKARYIIHAVGPRWGEGEEDEKLAEAVHGSLRKGEELKLQSISMPAISTGIFGFPVKRAAQIILNEIKHYYQEKPESDLKIVRLVLFDRATLEVFLKTLDTLEW